VQRNIGNDQQSNVKNDHQLGSTSHYLRRYRRGRHAQKSTTNPLMTGKISPVLKARINPLVSAKLNPIVRGVAASIVLGGIGAVSWAASPADAARETKPQATVVVTSGVALANEGQQTGNGEDASGNNDSATAVPNPNWTPPNPQPIAPAPTSAAPTPAPTTPSPQPSQSTPPASSSATTRQPVAGLGQSEMNNAVAIVTAGKQMNLPRQAFVVAIATSLQESRLRNLANPNVPGSMSHPNEGVGYDHDSVGLFQQRPNWGTVDQLMDPQESARRFYAKLVTITGWEQMAVTYAAQTVQQSAFPGAYAQHQSLAEQIVNAIG
jgi:hypothetical protein